MTGAGATPPGLVILLHGVAANGNALSPLRDRLAAAMPGVAVVAPDAPFAHDGDGLLCQWYSLSGVTRANRPARVAEAREALDHVLRTRIAAHGLAGDLHRVAIVGFSQGATMAFDAVASGRWPVAAVVTFACRLALPAPFAPSPTTRVLLVHGMADAAVPLRESETGWRRLRSAGVAADFLACAGIGHEISPAATAYAASFLSQALSAR